MSGVRKQCAQHRHCKKKVFARLLLRPFTTSIHNINKNYKYYLNPNTILYVPLPSLITNIFLFWEKRSQAV